MQYIIASVVPTQSSVISIEKLKGVRPCSRSRLLNLFTHSSTCSDESQIVLINEVDLSSEALTGGSITQLLMNKLVAAPVQSLSHYPNFVKCFGPYTSSKVDMVICNHAW